jgi:hypothetical protein
MENGDIHARLPNSSVVQKGCRAPVPEIRSSGYERIQPAWKVPEVCKELGISEQTYYRWRTRYGGMNSQMARQLQVLQKERPMRIRLALSRPRSSPTTSTSS